MATKKDQPKPAEEKPRAALATSRGGVTVIDPTLQTSAPAPVIGDATPPPNQPEDTTHAD